MLTQDGSWQEPEGSPFRSLCPEEVVALLDHAAAIDRDEVLFLERDGSAVTRLDDLHAYWDVQHPLLRQVLEQRGLHPAGDV